MEFFLIAIRKARWNRSERPDWIADDDFPAPPLADLRVNECGDLSAWLLDGARSNLDDVVTALAAARDHVANFDYAIFPQTLIEGLGVDVRETPGVTPHRQANRWHRDFSRVSARRLVEFAGRLFASADRKRVPARQVKSSLIAAIRAGAIAPGDLKDGVREKCCM